MELPALESNVTIFVPIDSPVIQMLREWVDEEATELSDQHWKDVWLAQISYKGPQILEVVESYGSVINVGG